MVIDLHQLQPQEAEEPVDVDNSEDEGEDEVTQSAGPASLYPPSLSPGYPRTTVPYLWLPNSRETEELSLGLWRHLESLKSNLRGKKDEIKQKCFSPSSL